MNKRLWAVAAGLGLTMGMLIAGPAHATPAPVCKSVVSNIVNHDDGGHHGVWAHDSFTRTVKVCEVAQGNYEATVTDAGTFVTVAGFSPRQGVPIPAGLTGTLTGGFTVKFKAASGFATYQGNHPGYGVSASLGTGAWVAAVWGPGVQVPGAEDWGWTYTTCAEQWVDKAPSDGTLPADGDITGKACPSRSPSPSPSRSASPSAGLTSVTRSPGAAAGSLPTTGSRTPLFLGITGGVLFQLGGVAWLLTRRQRRLEFRA